MLQAMRLLARYGEPWTPPSRAQETFDLAVACMGPAALGNYSSVWWKWCADPRTRQDVLETIAEWKLKQTHPRAKPWFGGKWRDRFHAHQRRRLAEAAQASSSAGGER